MHFERSFSFFLPHLSEITGHPMERRSKSMLLAINRDNMKTFFFHYVKQDTLQASIVAEELVTL